MTFRSRGLSAASFLPRNEEGWISMCHNFVWIGTCMLGIIKAILYICLYDCILLIFI